MHDDKVGNAAGKWGAIGLIVGGIFPYLVGGWIKEYSLITALGGAFLFGFIALEGAKAQSEEAPQNPPAPPQPPQQPAPQEEIEIHLEGASPIEDAGFLRRQFILNAGGHKVELFAVVDYNGVGPSGVDSKTKLKLLFTIPSINKSDGLLLDYISTERAIEVLTSLNSEIIIAFLGGLISKAIKPSLPSSVHEGSN